jgi:hypothetical protein
MSDTINSKENTEKKGDFDPELNTNGAFELINKTYVENLEKSEKLINDQFEFFLANKIKIKDNLKLQLKNAYQETTLNIEENLRTLEEDFSKVDTKNELAVKRLKQRLEQTTLMLENKDNIQLPYNQTFTNYNVRFNRLRLEKLLDENFTFDLGGENSYFGWSGESDPIMEIKASTGGSYKFIASTHDFENELTCKVRIIEIESGKVGSYWNYGFGLIKADNNNQGSYYTDSVVLQSNGHLNTQFSGSSNTSVTSTRAWAKDDILEVSRDIEGNVYFAMNDEERKKCFDNINFKMKVVMGFGSGMMAPANQFEMIECTEKF